jgi:hypothetical protein
VVLEGLVPYARESVDAWLGGPQETYCSSRAARRLAVMAWQRARTLGAEASAAVGVAATASLRSREEKRGDHRVVVAVQSLSATSVATLVLAKGRRTRAAEEGVAADLLLARLATAAAPGSSDRSPPLLAGEVIRVETAAPTAARQRVFAGTRGCVAARAADGIATPPAGLVVFPGSFDPLHEGHLRMAEIAAGIAGRPVEFELSVANVDKPALDYLEIEARAAQFAGRSLWLTHAARFLEKVALFPEATFVIGADTFARLGDPRYYGGSREAALDAARRIAAGTRGLIVFGREQAGRFVDPAGLAAPAPLRDIARFVAEREFRMDVSSTALRRGAGPAE